MRAWGTDAETRGHLGQLGIALLVATGLLAVSFAMTDLFLAALGGMVIGIVLGHWFLPWVVDVLHREELAQRLRRIPRPIVPRRGP